MGFFKQCLLWMFTQIMFMVSLFRWRFLLSFYNFYERYLGVLSRIWLSCLGPLVLLLPNTVGYPIFRIWEWLENDIPETRRCILKFISTFSLLFLLFYLFLDFQSTISTLGKAYVISILMHQSYNNLFSDIR